MKKNHFKMQDIAKRDDGSSFECQLNSTKYKCHFNFIDNKCFVFEDLLVFGLCYKMAIQFTTF